MDQEEKNFTSQKEKHLNITFNTFYRLYLNTFLITDGRNWMKFNGSNKIKTFKCKYIESGVIKV